MNKKLNRNKQNKYYFNMQILHRKILQKSEIPRFHIINRGKNAGQLTRKKVGHYLTQKVG
jgi:hypothetical protein